MPPICVQKQIGNKREITVEREAEIRAAVTHWHHAVNVQQIKVCLIWQELHHYKNNNTDGHNTPGYNWRMVTRGGISNRYHIFGQPLITHSSKLNSKKALGNHLN
jgi:hypothetical protein